MAKSVFDDDEAPVSAFQDGAESPQGAAPAPMALLPASGPAPDSVFSQGESDPTAQAPQSNGEFDPTAQQQTPQGAVPPVFSPNLEHNENAAQAKLSKLQYQDANPFGSIDNHPGTLGKIAHGASVTAQALGSVFAPHALVNVPGTEAYRNLHEQQLGDQVMRLDQEKEQNRKTEAETQNVEAQPEIAAAKNETAQEKIDEQRHAADAKNDMQLAQHGYVRDQGTGLIRAMRYEEMSPVQQGVADLKQSSANLADAKAAYTKAMQSGDTAGARLAQQRIEMEKKNIDLGYAKLGVSKEHLALEEDKTYNPEPTGGERTKADLAHSANTQIDTLEDVIKRRPEMFGPGPGRATKFKAWLGSSDADAATYRAAAQYLADHSAGVFGARGQYIMAQLHGLTDEKYTPEALTADLEQARKTNNGFVEAGTPHPKGGTSGYGKPVGGKPGGGIEVVAPDGSKHSFTSQAAADRFKKLAGVK